MKTVSILFTKSPGRMHFDFSTPKGLKIIPSVTKKINDRNKKQRSARKEIKRVEEKKDLLSFDFYMVYFGDLKREKKNRKNRIQAYYLHHVIYTSANDPPMIIQSILAHLIYFVQFL